jgi:hypothetical protein
MNVIYSEWNLDIWMDDSANDVALKSVFQGDVQFNAFDWKLIA